MTYPSSPLVVDTSVVSYVFNSDSRADFYLAQMSDKRLIVSFQTVEELWYGAAKSMWGLGRRSELSRHLEAYEVIWANPELVMISAELRAERRSAGHDLKLADAWIAATALLLTCPLASHDEDFVGIPNLDLVRKPSA